MMQFLCGCRDQRRWHCYDYRTTMCEGCEELHLGWHWHRRFCDTCRNRHTTKHTTARRRKSKSEQVRYCINCNNQIQPRRSFSNNRYGCYELVTLARLYCSDECSSRHNSERQRVKIKSDPELYAAMLEQKRTGGDPVKRRLRRERQNEVRRKRRLVAVAVQELFSDG